ncbi:hypothetical protein MA16_Dca007634 [Dendrobium catenatum]|uniref:Uncharacterized protein n=1 Tax=Dendrobium catenatum TaxID=906689 RepID=A0A2I0X0X1_9ASPA|nr:hypothetical protein MA16_Dca007634 [Dendrobium catenatum]
MFLLLRVPCVFLRKKSQKDPKNVNYQLWDMQSVKCPFYEALLVVVKKTQQLKGVELNHFNKEASAVKKEGGRAKSPSLISYITAQYKNTGVIAGGHQAGGCRGFADPSRRHRASPLVYPVNLSLLNPETGLTR